MLKWQLVIGGAVVRMPRYDSVGPSSNPAPGIYCAAHPAFHHPFQADQ